MVTPLVADQLAGQKRGWFASYELGNVTVIRTGVGGETLTNALGHLRAALGDTFAQKRFVFFGSAGRIAHAVHPGAAYTPSKYINLNHRDFLSGLARPDGSEDYSGRRYAPAALTVATLPGSWQGVSIAGQLAAINVQLVDQESYWFVKVMKLFGVSDYDARLVALDDVREWSDTLKPDTSELKKEFKQLLEQENYENS